MALNPQTEKRDTRVLIIGSLRRSDVLLFSVLLIRFPTGQLPAEIIESSFCGKHE